MRRVLLAVAVAVPLVIYFGEFVYFGFTALEAPEPFGEALPPAPHAVHANLLALAGLAVWLVVLATGFLVHAARATNFSRREKAFWVATLALLGPLAVPAYWYRQFWRSPPERPSR
jgi:hypothetical protein